MLLLSCLQYLSSHYEWHLPVFEWLLVSPAYWHCQLNSWKRQIQKYMNLTRRSIVIHLPVKLYDNKRYFLLYYGISLWPILIPISLLTLYWQIHTFTYICIGIPYTASLSINWYTYLRIFLIKMIKCKYRYSFLVRSNKQLKNNFKLFYGKNTKFTV